MTPSDPNVFEDRVLKEAVCRAWGGQTAPEALRQRVAAMGIGAGKAPAADVMPGVRGSRRGWVRILRHPNSIYGLAAAAMVIIGFSIASRFPSQDPYFPRPMEGGMPGQYPSIADFPDAAAAGVLPASVTRGVIEAHEACRSRAGDHQPFKSLSKDDYAGLRNRLGEVLGYPVLAAPVEDAQGGWEFRGGAVCPVARRPVSHLLFDRDGQAVSVFSLPRSSCPDAEAGEERLIPDPYHPLMVFVTRDGVYCVVGSSNDQSLTAENLRVIGNNLRKALRG